MDEGNNKCVGTGYIFVWAQWIFLKVAFLFIPIKFSFNDEVDG